MLFDMSIVFDKILCKVFSGLLFSCDYFVLYLSNDDASARYKNLLKQIRARRYFCTMVIVTEGFSIMAINLLLFQEMAFTNNKSLNQLKILNY
jgi:hypothetical protein